MILALCLALVAPAQASGMLVDDSQRCRHLAAAVVTGDQETPRDGAIHAPCHVMCATMQTHVALPSVSLGSALPVPRAALTISSRPNGIERPPKTDAVI